MDVLKLIILKEYLILIWSLCILAREYSSSPSYTRLGYIEGTPSSIIADGVKGGGSVGGGGGTGLGSGPSCRMPGACSKVTCENVLQLCRKRE
jgi:hypothetical protein